MMKQRVLVYEHLSAGGVGADAQLLAEGEAMRDAIVDGLRACPDIEVSRVVPAALAERDTGMLGPGRDESMLDFVAREAGAHDRLWLVAPETGGLLADFCARVEARRWVGCELETIRLASRKHATLLHLARCGLCTPLAFRSAGDVTHWVVKPDDGAGSIETRLHARLDAAQADASQRRQAGRSVTLEPWVPGEALSLSLLCRREQVELLSVNRQHIAVDREGQVSFEGVEHGAVQQGMERWRAFRHVAVQVAGAMPGLCGFVGVDLVWHPRWGPVVIEVNPRLTTAFVGLSQRLSRPLALEILACGSAGDGDDGPL